MKELSKRLPACGLPLLALLLLGGCEKKTNPPAAALGASVVASMPTGGHSHDVTIPFADMAASTTMQYVSSSAAGGHTHVIALTPEQFADLHAGKRVSVTSSPTADAHKHAWELLGGNLLYESICYNCHSNDKRGSAGMPGTNYTPLQSQRDALFYPAGAPLSLATPATPDPDFIGAAATATSADGAVLYEVNCAECHVSLAKSSKRGRTAAEIKAAIANAGTGMSRLAGLTDAQISAIAAALGK